MRRKVSKSTRTELVLRDKEEYRTADYARKNQILSDLQSATGYSRKHLISLLNSKKKPKPRKPRARTALSEEAQNALIVVWEVANCICSKRLVPFISEICANLRKNGHHLFSEAAEEQICKVSAATVDRVLKRERAKRLRSLSHTKRASTVKNKVPVRTFAEWNDVKPGFFEIDTVSHSSSDAHGPFLDSLNMTDIATCWTVPIAIPRKTALEVTKALQRSRELIPFPILGLDFDNGSEFLNDVVINWSKSKKVTCTRSRAYKKNDQAWIEEKNNSVVRKNVGRHRYSSDEALAVLTELYDVLAVYFNFFQPCQKLVEKRRDGAKTHKKHDIARTPYARVLESQHVSATVKCRLRAQKERLDMLHLSQELVRLRDKLRLLAEDVPNPILAVALAQRNAVQRFVSNNTPKQKEQKVRHDLTGESLQVRLTKLISEMPVGTKLTAPELSRFGKPHHLNYSLSILRRRGLLERIEHGVYVTTSFQLPPKRSVTKEIRDMIGTMDDGEPLTWRTFQHITHEKEIRTCLHRLAQYGTIQRLDAGIYARSTQETLPQK